MISAQSTSVDTISGATYSSKACSWPSKTHWSGIGRACRGCCPRPAAGGSSISPTTPSTLHARRRLRNGVYTDSAWGYSEDTPVSVRVTIANGKIANIELGTRATRPSIEPRLERTPGLVMQKQSVNVDTVTGATYSSEGIWAPSRAA
ncbi:MAG: FMN-binding protein [Collinsella sp.]